MKAVWRICVLSICALIAVLGIFAVLQLDEQSPLHLRQLVEAHLKQSGVDHPVTAVLLNFRGYDTFLEIAVLQLALLGILTTTGEARTGGQRVSGSPQAILQAMARKLTPMMVLGAGYLLWAGSHRPGGAFQAGAVLAACIVLLYLSGILAAWMVPRWPLRLALVFGFLIFLVVAGITLSFGALLEYPQTAAGSLIFLIEASLTISLAAILAGLFLWLPDENEEAEE